jgi:hypothetical protein
VPDKNNQDQRSLQEVKMSSGSVKITTKIAEAIAFVATIIVNYLAQNPGFNGITTAQVSDSYPNLFAPPGFTFAIWGVIYLLLALYTIYQFGVFQNKAVGINAPLLERVGLVFVISSVVNIAWILSWAYNIIPLSVVLMLALLVSLIYINQQTKNAQLEGRDLFFVRLPFAIYFGWITVATIANITTLLVSLGWHGTGISEEAWTALILVVGMIIGLVTLIRNRNFGYGLVLIWAYFGIYTKHVTASGFNNQYPLVITTTLICLVLFVIGEAYLLYANRKDLQHALG